MRSTCILYIFIYIKLTADYWQVCVEEFLRFEMDLQVRVVNSMSTYLIDFCGMNGNGNSDIMIHFAIKMCKLALAYLA